MIRDIDRRIKSALNTIRRPFRARLTAIDTAPGLSLLQAEGLAGEQMQAAELAQHYGLTSVPPVGSQAVVLPLGGKSAHGVIIATEHSSYRVKSLSPGEVAIYTDEGDMIVLKRGRIVEITTQTLKINASTKVEVNSPLLQVNGGDVKADTISLKTHKHGGVSTGSGQTGVPV
jgi:phage baseplate assembly protein V